MGNDKKLDIIYNFGKKVIVEARDRSIYEEFCIMNGESKVRDFIEIHKKFEALNLTEEQKKYITFFIMESVDRTINNFIWMMECNNKRFAFVAKEEDGSCFDIEQESDGLCVGQWEFIDRYSKYNTAEDILKTGEIEKKPEA